MVRHTALRGACRKVPSPLECIALIHCEKGGGLVDRVLYDEVKSVLNAPADDMEARDAEGATTTALPVAALAAPRIRALLVDKQVPLPSTQALLGRASVQTAAECAKTDQSKLHEVVELGFGCNGA